MDENLIYSKFCEELLTHGPKFVRRNPNMISVKLKSLSSTSGIIDLKLNKPVHAFQRIIGNVLQNSSLNLELVEKTRTNISLSWRI